MANDSSSSTTPTDCRFGIELQRSISTYTPAGRPQAYRMRIVVSDSWNVDPNIFIYRRNEPDAGTDVYRDTFEAVASPLDLEEYPVSEPRPDDIRPYFRLAEVDIMSRNKDLLDQTWLAILEDRDELIRTLTYTCELTLAETSRGGQFPADPTPDPDPVPVDPGGSTEPETCPDDPYTSLIIVDSNDPDFPVGAVLSPTGSSSLPGCERTWELLGAVSGTLLSITTSLVTHEYNGSVGGVLWDNGGVADDYAMFMHYMQGDDEYSIRLAGQI